MRIGVFELFDQAADGHGLLMVEHREGMMGKRWNRQKTGQPGG
jgi:hypothetical protein